jgi:regulator of replication initiation timing
VLKFDFEEVEDSAAKRVNIDLTKPSKETLKALDNLAQEGFAVCDVFLSDKFSVLLERSL